MLDDDFQALRIRRDDLPRAGSEVAEPSDGPSVRPVVVLAVSLGEQRVAFLLADVDEVLPAVEVAPLPHAPAVVRGLINLRGEPLPIIDLRSRLGLLRAPAHPDNHVLVCQVAGRALGVWVDRAEGVRQLEVVDIAPLDAPATGRHFAGAAMVEDGVLLVSDVGSFLNVAEAERLEQALAMMPEAPDHA